MTNEIEERKPVFGGRVAMVNASKLAEAMADSAAKDPRGAAADGMDYMNFSGKGGRYEIGQEKTDADPSEAWLVNIGAFEDGWICWKENRTAATRLYPMGTPVPAPDTSEHGPFTRDGDGWYQAKSLVARSLDSGQQVYFKINSVSGVSVFAGLQRDVLQRIRAGMASWPVISFDKEKFTSKGYTNWKPIIKLVGWLDDERVQSLSEMFENPEAEIDLDDMFASSAQSTPSLPSAGEVEMETPLAEVAAKAKRRRPEL